MRRWRLESGTASVLDALRKRAGRRGGPPDAGRPRRARPWRRSARRRDGGSPVRTRRSHGTPGHRAPPLRAKPARRRPRPSAVQWRAPWPWRRMPRQRRTRKVGRLWGAYVEAEGATPNRRSDRRRWQRVLSLNPQSQFRRDLAIAQAGVKAGHYDDAPMITQIVN